MDYYPTPNDPDFEELGEDCVEEALFLIKDENDQRALCEVHLCDCDEESPSGYAWDFTVYKWDNGHWIDWDGGRYWDYASADALLDFDLPATFGKSEIRLVDPRDDHAVVFDDLAGYYNEHVMFSDEDWENATSVVEF